MNRDPRTGRFRGRWRCAPIPPSPCNVLLLGTDELRVMLRQYAWIRGSGVKLNLYFEADTNDRAQRWAEGRMQSVRAEIERRAGIRGSRIERRECAV